MRKCSFLRMRCRQLGDSEPLVALSGRERRDLYVVSFASSQARLSELILQEGHGLRLSPEAWGP